MSQASSSVAGQFSRPATAINRLEEATFRRVTWRVLPLFFICYFVAYLDRVNVAFAKLQMLSDLHLSEAVYGVGAGIFFIGYCIFEVPSNMILHKVGARLWISRIMLTWGALSIAMVWAQGETSFYVLRFLLGVAEAGFYPGVLLYLSQWFPASRRGRITALFMAGNPLSGIIGGPVSGLVMQMFGGMLGLASWQWLFIIEGVPALILAAVVFFTLTDRIEDTRWLDASEKEVLHRALSADAQAKTHKSYSQAFGSARVWLLCLVYFGISIGSNTIGFWQPTIIKGSGISSPLTIGLLSSVPYLVALGAMLLAGRSADRLRERRWHVIVPLLATAIGLFLCAQFRSDLLPAMLCLCLSASGIVTTIAMFWALPTAFLDGAAAAAGIALINSTGNLGGFVSPAVMGWLAATTHSLDSGLYATSAWLVMTALLVLVFVPARLVNR
jgi:D-galactonate transporter